VSEASDVTVDIRDDHVAVVELHRPPHNYTDVDLLSAMCDHLDELAATGTARAVVLCSEGRSFSAGANFAAGGVGGDGTSFGSGTRRFYDQALRIFESQLPIVAAVHGPAIGAGLGLALACDLRVTCPEAWFGGTFTRLGIHPGFGISVTLPELIGPARAADVLLTGRRIQGDEALALGLANRCVAQAEVRDAAIALAGEIAAAAPLAVVATRATLRRGLADRVRDVLHHELETQNRLSATADAAEGIAATAARRAPIFRGE
jgi:enoyl-CoA hydratase/carnithine racemase